MWKLWKKSKELQKIWAVYVTARLVILSMNVLWTSTRVSKMMEVI